MVARPPQTNISLRKVGVGRCFFFKGKQIHGAGSVTKFWDDTQHLLTFCLSTEGMFFFAGR